MSMAPTPNTLHVCSVILVLCDCCYL